MRFYELVKKEATAQLLIEDQWCWGMLWDTQMLLLDIYRNILNSNPSISSESSFFNASTSWCNSHVPPMYDPVSFHICHFQHTHHLSTLKSKLKWSWVRGFFSDFYLVRWSTKLSTGQAIRFRQNSGNSVFFESLKSFHLATTISLAWNNAKAQETQDEDFCGICMPPRHPCNEWRIATWAGYYIGKNLRGL